MTISKSAGGPEVPRSIERIIEQHATDAAFLWAQRQGVLNAPHYRLHDLAAFDDRLQANLDGLRIADDCGWEFCTERLSDEQEAGEVFAAAVLALEQGSPKRLEVPVSLVGDEPRLATGLTSALGWVPRATAHIAAQELLGSVLPVWRQVAIATYAIHRLDPGRALADALEDKDPAVRARALRAVGELGRHDLVPELEAGLHEKSDLCRFWAAASAVLLGDQRNALEVLESFSTLPGPLQPRALQLSLRAGDTGRARKVVERLRDDSSQLRTAVQAAGICGDSTVLPWLLEQLENPHCSRVVAEAFSLVTGLDLESEGLTAHGSPTGPSDEDDMEQEVLELDPDEHLPTPDPEKLRRWYRTHKDGFVKGSRSFLGVSPSIDGCANVWHSGTQRQRIAASLYLRLLDCTTTLNEWRAPAWRQQFGPESG
ncbi:TIGR02270 family protein [Myxococcus landrumensis]|uniref:TIGR02270 family protein n=1 Tax=Myxococcus landrumensis TaxID=2813577 RepID=A0ABX7MX70_9BACT|nr:TIGR02270 family protein [Myxococcus landrumus]QSQ11042.1 TIGR02270 family protein [Myxococcus landrumus]